MSRAEDEMRLCPTCGALPCDWTQDPHAGRDLLIMALADIRIRTGVNEKPMLSDLPVAIAEAMNARILRAAKRMQDACADNTLSAAAQVSDLLLPTRPTKGASA